MFNKKTNNIIMPNFLLSCTVKIKTLLLNYFQHLLNNNANNLQIMPKISELITTSQITAAYQINQSALVSAVNELKTRFLHTHKTWLLSSPLTKAAQNKAKHLQIKQAFHQWLDKTIEQAIQANIIKRHRIMAMMLSDIWRDQLISNKIAPWIEKENCYFYNQHGEKFDLFQEVDSKFKSDILNCAPDPEKNDITTFQITDLEYQTIISTFFSQTIQIFCHFGIHEITVSRAFITTFDCTSLVDNHEDKEQELLQAQQARYDSQLLSVIYPTHPPHQAPQRFMSSRHVPQPENIEIELQPIVKSNFSLPFSTD